MELIKQSATTQKSNIITILEFVNVNVSLLVLEILIKRVGSSFF